MLYCQYHVDNLRPVKDHKLKGEFTIGIFLLEVINTFFLVLEEGEINVFSTAVFQRIIFFSTAEINFLL